jgi:hypothetical protein
MPRVVASWCPLGPLSQTTAETGSPTRLRSTTTVDADWLAGRPIRIRASDSLDPRSSSTDRSQCSRPSSDSFDRASLKLLLRSGNDESRWTPPSPGEDHDELSLAGIKAVSRSASSRISTVTGCDAAYRSPRVTPSALADPFPRVICLRSE